ncbi:glycosyltransferase family A protein [Halomonas saccharevitans]|uniref:Glycosyltransferase family A protein n=1 Tax=Halomonas saccharevitans TaxID=416872 RepID=A0ABU3NAU1_9GAMM|nr:glycosyltransferase family A protein [Halomonas saccharevitans]MDT8878308.1 glycosyltransferase family A protein [Halomonas saccharevitans]
MENLTHSELMVSVVVPVSNRHQELLRALLSIREQDYKNIEVIVVENNSSDPGEVESFALQASLRKMKFFSISECANANVARNFGVGKSSGTLIAFLDSDDEWLPNHISNCIGVLHDNCADFVYGAAVIDNGEHEFVRDAWRLHGCAVNYLVGHDNGFAPTSSYLIKKNVFKRVLWDETLSRHQDYDFFIRCSFFSKMVVNRNADIRIHWKKGELRNFSALSMIDFYHKWRGFMEPSVERRYIKGAIKDCAIHKELAFSFYFFCKLFFLSLRRRFI